MKSEDYILVKQKYWAKSIGLKLLDKHQCKKKDSDKRYTKKLKKNLFLPLDTEAVDEFRNADGNELSIVNGELPNMCAVHSSSALCVNVFMYWKNKDISDLIDCLGLDKTLINKCSSIHFERKFKISKKFQKDPNIDIAIEDSDAVKKEAIKIIGIECKFSEAYHTKSNKLSPKYLAGLDSLWDGLTNTKELAKTISPEDKESYSYLHPAQLIKHLLALQNNFGDKGYYLLYLWYDVPGKDGYLHREEINKFSDYLKKDGVNFHSISYQELIVNLRNRYYKKHKKYIDYLINRYL